MSNDRRQWVAARQDDLVDDRDGKNWRRGLFRGTAHHDDWRARHWTSRLLHRVGEIVASAGAGVVAALLAVSWAVVGVSRGFPTWWATALYSMTASVTFVMVFVIQHTQQRQTAATQRKLDELLRSSEQADSTLIAVEEASEGDLEALTRQHVAAREQAQAGTD